MSTEPLEHAIATTRAVLTTVSKEQLGNDFDFQLFKFPADLERALLKETPLVLFLSNYSWNFELGESPIPGNYQVEIRDLMLEDGMLGETAAFAINLGER